MRFFRPVLFSALTVFVLLIGLVACDVAKQFNQLAALSRCQYQIANVSDMAVAGVSVQNKTSFSAPELLTLGAAYFSNNLPLTMNLNLNVKNPNKDTAALSQVDYIMALDGNQLTQGSLPKRFSVGPGQLGVLPIPINVELKSALSGQSQDAILGLVLNLAGQSSKPTKIGLKIRPSFQVAGQTMQFPNYFTVNTELRNDSLGQ